MLGMVDVNINAQNNPVEIQKIIRLRLEVLVLVMGN
jgi:hypothetical protein